MFKFLGALAASTALLATSAAAQTATPDQAQFRALYKELVETNTSLSAGSCTLAAQRMAAHLKAAGFADAYFLVGREDVQPFYAKLGFAVLRRFEKLTSKL